MNVLKENDEVLFVPFSVGFDLLRCENAVFLFDSDYVTFASGHRKKTSE